jgi:hypothetical protein
LWERWLSLTTTCTFVSDSSPLVSQWGPEWGAERVGKGGRCTACTGGWRWWLHWQWWLLVALRAVRAALRARQAEAQVCGT